MPNSCFTADSHCSSAQAIRLQERDIMLPWAIVQQVSRGLSVSTARARLPASTFVAALSFQPLLQEFVPVQANQGGVPSLSAAAYPERLSALASDNASFLNKCRAIRSVSEGAMALDEVFALTSFVATRSPMKDEQEDLKFLSLKNDALVCLIQAEPLPDDFGGLMLSMVVDETEGPIWREYSDTHGSTPRRFIRKWLSERFVKSTPGLTRLQILKLEEFRNTAMLDTMNAAQIIEEIQRLPEDERGKVLDFARHQPNAETLEAMREPTDDLPRFETVEDLFKELLD
ncbi:hypothetical protein QEH52_19325 [Coraliomargarita sp. SDUM461003]|uniref:Uncharacterized protein n=1 Tax=Thalassobacterium maritimum TaxID=3041265 RepID=A0ABU1B1U9_9BACT|nr:hypothetical protein [Coraliomargarita sp. SDUM461003]MDQ8209679.1 hypothetical protein [Coraliomargarita sp. SDUM461003]